MNTTAIARNAPCPCGSGKRYKDCHGGVGDAPSGPVTAESLLREAQVAFAVGRAAAAHALLGRAVALAPERADLLRERARVEMTLGDVETAEESCRAALDRKPEDVTAWNLLGEILRRTDAGAAEAAWRHALTLDPESAEASFHVGNCERQRGATNAAIVHYERALRSAPEHTGVLNNLGLALAAMGQIERAEACYRDLLAVDSQHADALANLATLLHDQKRFKEAVAAYERAAATRRDFPAKFWIQRALALAETGAIPAGEASLREAARLDPDHMPTQVDIGSLCVLQEKYEEAEVFFSRALGLDPDNAYAVAMFVHCRLQRCRWDGLDEYFSTLRRYLENDAPKVRYNVVPFPLLAMPLAPRLQLNAARRWAEDLAARVAPPAPRPATSRPPGARLRVGFVSSDFREHPIASLLVECWERIDRTRIETFAYNLLSADPGPMGRRIAHAFEHFVDVGAEPAPVIAGRINEDWIDVLIDLNGYTTYAKSEIFALKPASVQINWLGYLGTLGADWYDYVLTDQFACPPALQPFFTERFLYLPDCYCPSDTKRPVAAVAPDRAACGLPETGFVFCCFNNCYKILPSVFAIWMRLLAELPGSVLWLAPGNAIAGANLRREARLRGVDASRLVFAPRVSLSEHLARHVHADLFLDTAPYNAGTTANDALFIGVPVLTCAGDTMASRVAGSQLHAIGLPELVTASLGEYEALALALARDPARLRLYRQRLRANRATHPLFDMTRFTRALDDLLHAAWENRSLPQRS
jgi:protein O-GlcNAc transferase